MTAARRRAKGEGSVTAGREDGVWRLRWTDPPTGKVKQKTYRGSKSAAARELRRLMTGAAEAAGPSEGRTFGDVLDAWLAYGKVTRGDRQGEDWSPRTATENELMVETRIRPVLGHVPLAELTSGLLEDVYAGWQSGDGGWRDGLKTRLSNRSVAKLAATIKSALNFAARRGWVERNVAPMAVAPGSAATTEFRVPTHAEVVRLIEAAREYGHGMDLAVGLAAVTGLREGEVCGLRWEDVDVRRGVVRVRLSAYRDKDGTVKVKEPKTRASARDVPVPGGASVLREVVGRPGPAGRYVVGGGEFPMSPHKVSDHFRKVRATAKVRGVRFHDLRDYFATTLLAYGVPVFDVAKALGHTTAAMVIARYGHPSEDWRARVAAVSAPAIGAGR